MADPLVLIPGLLCDARLFAHQAAAASRDRMVIHASLAEGGDLAGMADAILAQAPERFALAGFSMGGVIALDIAARAPGLDCIPPIAI